MKTISNNKNNQQCEKELGEDKLGPGFSRELDH